MNIAIIGGGSIGLLTGYYLSKHHEVTLYVKREAQKKALQLNNINLYQTASQYKSKGINAALLEEIHSQFDLYIICVKQTQLNEVLTMTAHVLNHQPLLFLQNGMGHIESLQEYKQAVYLGVVSHGAHRVANNEVKHLGNGSIKVASLTSTNEALDSLIKTLHQEEFPIEASVDWELLLKEKLIVNAVINPITALFDVTNGEIIHNRHLNHIAKKLCEETATVLQLPIDESWNRIEATAKSTEKNISSMRADIQENRKTELEAITGYVLKNAVSDLPYTSLIYHAILALEERISSI